MYLEVLLASLLPLLGHGARPDGASKHASESKERKGTSNHSRREEEDLAALIRRRGTAGAVGTESNEVSCKVELLLACVSDR